MPLTLMLGSNSLCLLSLYYRASQFVSGPLETGSVAVVLRFLGVVVYEPPLLDWLTLYS